MLSRESTGIPEAEARSLVTDLDADAKFEIPEEGLLVAETSANPVAIESRVAFSRRVGMLIPDGELDDSHLALLRTRDLQGARLRGGDGGEEEEAIISSIAEKVEGKVSLESPDREVSAYVDQRGEDVHGDNDARAR